MTDERPPDSRIPSIGVIALAAFLLCLPFLGSLPFMDPDEAFYPATAAESMESGDALDLRLNGQPRWVKPPGQYALIQVSFALFGKSEFAARLVPVLEGALLVLLLGLLVKRLAGVTAGRLSALVLASTLAHAFYSRAAHPEMALSLGTATGTLLLACWLLEDRPPRWLPLAAGLALGFAFVAKGPVCLVPPLLMLFVGLPLLKAEARPSWKRALGGFSVAAGISVALAAPWFLWMGAKHGDVFWDTVFGQLGHLTSDKYARDNASLLYFVPVLLAGSLPWLGVLPQSLRRVKRGETANRERLRTLMAATLLGTFVFFSLSSSQRVNYGLHFFPPLAIVVGLWLEDVLDTPGSEGVTRWALVPAYLLLGVALWAAHTVPVLETEWGSAHAPGRLFIWLLVAPLVVASFGNQSSAFRAKALGIFGAVLVAALVTAAAPWGRTYAPYRSFTERVRMLDNTGRDDVAVYRKRLPSVTFYMDREIPWPHSGEELREFLAKPGRPWLIIRDRHTETMLDRERFEVHLQEGEWTLLRRAQGDPGGMK
ncbi:MAG: ArnT family glycosyltransferase [Planctomycetota bacterium]